MPALKKIAAVKAKTKAASKAKTAPKRQAQPKRAAPAPHQAAPAPPPAPEPAPPAPVSAPAVAGKARAQIVAACSRPDGATAKELFAITGWTYASWSHQLKLAAKATGWTPHIEAIEGTKRYFLCEPAGH